MKNKAYLLYLYLITFYILFMPSINTFGEYTKYFMILTFLVIEIITRIIVYKKVFFKRTFKEIFNKKYLPYLFITLIAQIYYIFIVIINNHIENARILQYIYLIILYVTIIFICNDLKRIKLSTIEIKKFIINIFIVQGLICLSMVIIPPLKQIANTIYMLNGNTNTAVMLTRVYGITSDYTFGLPIISALVAGITLFENKMGNRKYIYSILIAISTFLNNRTGILIYIIFCLTYFITNIEKNKRIKDMCKIIILIFITAILLNLFVPKVNYFIMSGIKDFINLLNGKLTGNFKILDHMLYFPKKIINILFGLGIRVYGINGLKLGYYPSDIGYVNDIFMGGIIYAILLYISIWFVINKNNKKTFWLIIISLLIINFKGELFRSTYILGTIYMLYSFFEEEKNIQNKNKDLISVICPMYNVEKYIDECIESIMSNTYKNIELILVDDGSTDKTLAKAKKYQKKYKNIIILKQQNQGAPTARNLGIEVSKGKYIILFDSDDIMEKTFIEHLHNEIYNNDFSFGNYTYVDDNKNPIEFRKITEKYNPFDIKSLYFLDPFPNNKIFRSDIIKKNNIKFDNVKIAQDLNFYLKYLNYVKKVGFSTENESFYRIHSTGISRSYTLKILEIEKSINLTKSENTNSDEYKVLKLEHYYAQMVKIPNYNENDKKIIKDYFKKLILEQKLYMNKYIFKTTKYICGIMYYMVK